MDTKNNIKDVAENYFISILNYYWKQRIWHFQNQWHSWFIYSTIRNCRYQLSAIAKGTLIFIANWNWRGICLINTNLFFHPFLWLKSKRLYRIEYNASVVFHDFLSRFHPNKYNLSDNFWYQDAQIKLISSNYLIFPLR